MGMSWSNILVIDVIDFIFSFFQDLKVILCSVATYALWINLIGYDTTTSYTNPLSPHTWPDLRLTPHVRELPSQLIKADSLFMHSSLLSIHLYHTQSSFLAPHTNLFHSTFAVTNAN